ncbi:MAG: hypothetical protein J4O14_05850 [Chloroflexi bacterium]|nr:hypothetical protein [Chloroflexota bacterium]MCI0883108.1 hypothetical protein [Chloroflexota bacterium]
MTRLLPPFVALAAAALVSCTGGDGLSPTAVPDAETATASAEPRDCPAGEPGSSGDIDWVEPPVPGKQIAEVSCRLSGSAGLRYKVRTVTPPFSIRARPSTRCRTTHHRSG